MPERGASMKKIFRQAMKCAKNNQYLELLEYVKQMNPYEFKDFEKILFAWDKDGEFFEHMGTTLSYEEMHEFFELGSSRREREFIIERAKKGKFTRKDNINLRGCDF